jgi:hypothetical protein
MTAATPTETAPAPEHRLSGQITILATALEALHHGAGTEGNTQILRVQEGIDPATGEETRTPLITGNSIKHCWIREAGVRFALEAMAIPDGSLTKPVVDLLFSGGGLSKTGTSVNLDRSRRLERLFPILGLCGYGAGNTMTSSKLRVDNLHVVCAENGWRLPASAKDSPLATKRAGLLRSESFGTRHESTRSPHVFRLLTSEEQSQRTLAVSAKQKKPTPEKGDSAQMIYSFEVLKPGAQLWGCIHFEEITDLELVALRSALSRACEGVHTDGRLIYRVGAKASIGLGRVAVAFDGAMREGVRAPAFSEAAELVPTRGSSDLDRYRAHLREHTAEILETLAELV